MGTNEILKPSLIMIQQSWFSSGPLFLFFLKYKRAGSKRNGLKSLSCQEASDLAGRNQDVIVGSSYDDQRYGFFNIENRR